MTSEIEYDDFGQCRKCGGDNKYTVKDSINHTICEAETECKECGHKDYWAYGWFESRVGGVK